MKGGLCGGSSFHGPVCVCSIIHSAGDFRVCLEQIACGLPYCVAAAAKQESREERRFNLSVRGAQRPNAHPPSTHSSRTGS